MKRAAAIFIFIAFMALNAGAQEKKTYRATDADTRKGIEFANKVIKMRSNLARTHVKSKGVISEETAGKVCIAVDAEAKRFQEKNKANGSEIYIVRFVSERPRNPVNAADDDEKRVLGIFNGDRKVSENWHGLEINDKQYYRYMRPIFAEKPCLACHGNEQKVPAFIKKKYPKDESFGFKDGDLMGAVAVFTWKGW